MEITVMSNWYRLYGEKMDGSHYTNSSEHSKIKGIGFNVLPDFCLVSIMFRDEDSALKFLGS